MKRINNLYEKIISLENLELADKKAQKNKKKQYGVISHNKNRNDNILNLHNVLKYENFKTSNYSTFKIYENKERIISKLPYYPDRIVHHAIMNILEPIFLSTFTTDTYSSIKNRGIHLLLKKLKNSLTDYNNTKYCLKIDIKKFYPSINHEILKNLLKRKFKDKKLLNLLNEIIDSSDGIPIGNYLSQYFANFYLTGFDHWIKEFKKVKYYYRYADDIVILSNNKEELHKLLFEIKNYLCNNLKLKVKENYQIFPVEIRGVDFIGYKFYHSHILLRKTIKQKFIQAIINNKTKSLPSYYGWLKHCNSKHLIKKYNDIMIKNFKDLNIKNVIPKFIGERIKVKKILDQEIIVIDYKISKSKYDYTNKNCLTLQIEHNNIKKIVFTGSNVLINTIEQINKEDFPFKSKIIEKDEHYEFI